MKKSLLLSVIIVGVLFTSCRKSSNSSYIGQPQVNYQLIASNTNYAVPNNPAISTTAAGNIVWTSGFAYPDVVKFEATQNNIQVEIKSTNNAQIDLMSPVALTFGAFTLPPGIYNEIELKIDLDKTNSTPVVLQLNGHFTSGAVTLPVVVQVTQSVELQTEQHNITITNDSSYLAVTTLDLSAITAGITADMLLNAQLTSGSIVISADANHDLYGMILDNLGHEHHHFKFEGHHH